jgi:ankyrin repeat protein
VIDVLLSAGADPNLIGSNIFPPLHLAAMCGNVEIVDKLINAGASMHAVDFVNFSALHCATYFSHEKV